MKDLETLTVKELQAELIEMGVPEDDAMAFRTKAPAIASIRMLQTRSNIAETLPEGEDEIKRVKSIEETPKPSEERQVNKSWKNKAEAMKHRLLSQPTISILVPLEPTEKKGVVVWADNKTGDKMSVEVWNGLTVDQKMNTYQVQVAGDIESVQLNGYKYFIPKGQYTPVPQQVAEVISRSQQQTLDAGSEISLDRIDPKTGRPYTEIL